MSEEKGKLQRITEIELLGKKFDLAKNGGFKLCIVENDAYGSPRATELDLMELVSVVGPGLRPPHTEGDNSYRQKEVMQALLNLAGDALVRLQSHRDARLGTGNQED